jgi:hypothetical protein
MKYLLPILFLCSCQKEIPRSHNEQIMQGFEDACYHLHNGAAKAYCTGFSYGDIFELKCVCSKTGR